MDDEMRRDHEAVAATILQHDGTVAPEALARQIADEMGAEVEAAEDRDAGMWLVVLPNWAVEQMMEDGQIDIGTYSGILQAEMP